MSKIELIFKKWHRRPCLCGLRAGQYISSGIGGNDLEHRNELGSINDFQAHFRNLPHFEQPGSVYFITFRTAKDFVLSDTAKDIVFAAIKFHAGKKYDLHTFVIMEDHVHVIMQPLEESKGSYHSISEIMHSIKSYTANRIQRTIGRKGSVWLDENFDRIIRDDEEYRQKLYYILNNPKEAGLTDTSKHYRWLFWEDRKINTDKDNLIL